MNQYMKVQDFTFNSSKVTIGIKSRYGYMDACTAESSKPLKRFQRLGHKIAHINVEVTNINIPAQPSPEVFGNVGSKATIVLSI